MLTNERYEQQKNELKVIQSIYDKNVKAIKIQDCWKVCFYFILYLYW